MKRSYQSLPSRTRWELILSAGLLIAIASVLVIPVPRQWGREAREQPVLFHLMESDYVQPMFASARTIQALNSSADRFVGFGGYDEFQSYIRLPEGHARANITRYAGPTLSLLGVEFILRDSPKTRGPRVFISESFWERAYHRDASVVGGPILVNGHAYRIAGITRKTTNLATQTDLWMPVCSREVMGESTCLRVIGALPADSDWNKAQKELVAKCATRMSKMFSSALSAPKILPLERAVYFGDPKAEMFARARSSAAFIKRAG